MGGQPGQEPLLTRRQAQSAATRESVMASALEVFSERTFTGARVQEVADRAEVSLGTIYNYFENKEALGNAVYQRWKSKTRDYGVEVERGGSPREVFGAYWSQLAAFQRDHPAAFAFIETQHHSPYLDAQSVRLAESIDRAALDAFVGWQRSGAVRSGDANLLLAMIVGVFTSMVAERARVGQALDQETLDFGEACAWDMIRPS